MHVISRKRLVEFWMQHPQAEQPLTAWFAEVKSARWKTPQEIKAVHRNASILPNQPVVFNIKGNDYRIVIAIEYQKGIVFIRFVSTHEEYHKIDATTV